MARDNTTLPHKTTQYIDPAAITKINSYKAQINNHERYIAQELWALGSLLGDLSPENIKKRTIAGHAGIVISQNPSLLNPLSNTKPAICLNKYCASLYQEVTFAQGEKPDLKLILAEIEKQKEIRARIYKLILGSYRLKQKIAYRRNIDRFAMGSERTEIELMEVLNYCECTQVTNRTETKFRDDRRIVEYYHTAYTTIFEQQYLSPDQNNLPTTHISKLEPEQLTTFTQYVNHLVRNYFYLPFTRTLGMAKAMPELGLSEQEGHVGDRRNDLLCALLLEQGAVENKFLGSTGISCFVYDMKNVQAPTIPSSSESTRAQKNKVKKAIEFNKLDGIRASLQARQHDFITIPLFNTEKEGMKSSLQEYLKQPQILQSVTDLTNVPVLFYSPSLGYCIVTSNEYGKRTYAFDIKCLTTLPALGEKEKLLTHTLTIKGRKVDIYLNALVGKKTKLLRQEFEIEEGTNIRDYEGELPAFALQKYIERLWHNIVKKKTNREIALALGQEN